MTSLEKDFQSKHSEDSTEDVGGRGGDGRSRMEGVEGPPGRLWPKERSSDEGEKQAEKRNVQAASQCDLGTY